VYWLLLSKSWGCRYSAEQHAPEQERPGHDQVPHFSNLMMSRQVIVGWVLAALLIAPLFTLTRDRQGDAPVYRAAALRWLHGEQIYRPTDAAAFSYPPFFVVAYIPFAQLPQPWDRTAWCFCNLMLLGYILWALQQMLGPTIQQEASKKRLATGPAYAVIGLLSTRFLMAPIEYQGHDLIVFALFMTALTSMAADHYGRGGFWTGLAAACKATPLLLMIDFIWQRRWRALALCLLAVILASLLPDVIIANPDRPLWVQSWYDKFLSHIDVANAPQAAGAWTSWNMLNQSLSGTLYRLGTYVDDPTELRWNTSLIALSPRALAIVSAAAKLLVLAAVSYAVWPSSSPNKSLRSREFMVALRGAAVLLGMLLLSPMSSKQHFCVLLVPITVLVLDWFYYGRRPIVTTALALLFTLGMLAGKDVVGASLHKQLNAYGSLTWLTLICLVACCDISRRARHMEHEDLASHSGARGLALYIHTPSPHRFRSNNERSTKPRSSGLTKS